MNISKLNKQLEDHIKQQIFDAGDYLREEIYSCIHSYYDHQVEIDAPSFVVIVPKVGHKPSRGDSARHAETELKKEASVTQKSGLAQMHVSTGPSTAE